MVLQRLGHPEGRIPRRHSARYIFFIAVACRNATRKSSLARADEVGREASSPAVVLMPLDITKPNQIEGAATNAMAAGGVDVVFNNTNLERRHA